MLTHATNTLSTARPSAQPHAAAPFAARCAASDDEDPASARRWATRLPGSVTRVRASSAGPRASAEQTIVPDRVQRAAAEMSTWFRSLQMSDESSADQDEPALGQIWTTRVLAGPDPHKSHRAQLADSAGTGASDRGPAVDARLVVMLLHGSYPAAAPETLVGVRPVRSDTDGSSTTYARDGRRFSVAPISVETVYSTNFDLLVEQASSPLGYEFMVEVWNAATVAPPQLGRCLGRLNDRYRADLAVLHGALLDEDVDLTPLTGRVGPAILHDSDPRAIFQEREIEACAYLRRPLLALEWEAETADVAAAVMQPVEHEDLVTTLGDVVAITDETLAGVVPPPALGELRRDATPVAALRDSRSLAAVIGGVVRRLGLQKEAALALFSAVRETVRSLRWHRDPHRGATFARTQRAGSIRATRTTPTPPTGGRRRPPSPPWKASDAPDGARAPKAGQS